MANYKIVQGYYDTWKTGTPITLFVPYITEEVTHNELIETADEMTIGDPLWSFLVPTKYIEQMSAAGFTNVIEVTSTEQKIYVTENNYCTFQLTGTSTSRYELDWYVGDAAVKLANTTYGNSFINYIGEDDSLIDGITWILVNKSNYDTRYTYKSTTDELFRQFWAGSEVVGEDDDPYKDGGTSGTGGGTGTFSGTGDSIEFPNLPTLSAVSTGFITLFNPSIAQMQSLATYMWSDVFDIGLYKTLFADPMDCILGCSIVPVAVPNGGTKTVNVGNVSTGISMTVAASQYVEVDCGTLNVEEFWGSYLDYDPYTKAEIYLPYCGTHAIQVDDIMGKAVHVKYHVDILSGACCAYVKCGGSVMYSFVGQCSSSIPISANDWTNVVNGALTIAASVGSLIATGGASAPMAVGAAAAVTGTIYGGGIKQNVEKSGSMGGTGGMLAVQTPYLILTRPRQALPKKQNTYTGYPSFITTKLSDLKGYTEIDSIRITGVPATDAELNELESILKSGVIF